ncbi:MAG: hypothetical protein K0R61_508 [Microvirga sp.]|nr:hypothetical protein [Microvirga sp.]MDF2970058.1 hypothetical protein [Microvirga sp.]
MLHALIQVVFALNCECFPGEKRLFQALEKLPAQPRAFSLRLQDLLFMGKDMTAAQLREQHRELGLLVADVEQLVLADP